MRSRWWWVCAMLLMMGCAGGKDASESGSAGAGDENYTVRGVFVERTMNGQGIRVNHEEIPDYMAAMTMDFPVRDSMAVMDFEAGDKIQFTLTLTATEGYAHDFEKLDPATPLDLAK